MRKIMVTGAAGFIGSNFVRMLIEQGCWDVVGYDLLTYAGNLENLSEFQDCNRFKFIKADICDHLAVRKAMSDIDVVVNFAAESHVDRSIESSEDFIRTNVEGTRVLVDEAMKAKVDLFVQISTDEVYGSLGLEGLFTEDTPIQPNSPYSASKAAADLLVLAYHHTYDFPVIVTRCSNNYGPYQFPEKIIPLFVTNLMAGRKVPVYGDGMQIRDWIHVSDHCKGILAAIDKGKAGQVYNFGGNSEKANIELTKILLKQLGRNESYIEYVADRLGHDRRYAIDASKAKAQLNWQPEVEFEQGLKDTVKWYIENEQWWRPLRDQ
ncbi:MAG: dTDP-glucose 4,6-dehydratase [Phycisphaerae bacterium]|nr:dTDP-glucose 4,6-dehydratase [Phycisphaerae bacterium]